MKQPSTIDTLDRLEPGSRVAIIRLRSLGDCVLSTPAIHLLKGARPDLQIAVVAEDRFAPVFRNNPDISAVLPPRIGELRSFEPALCLNLHGGTRSARLTMLSGAGIKAGFDIFKPAWAYNTRIPTAQEVLGIDRRVHTAEHMAAAMFYLGVPIAEVPRAQMYASANASNEPYAVLHPVAATPEKAWPSSRFLEVADYIGQRGIEPIFAAGPGDDLSPFKKWRTVSGAPLDEVAGLMRGAQLFIGNDSGPAHVAAAFGVPEVVIFGPSDAETWAPWRTKSAVLKAEGPIARITVGQVILAVNRVLQP
ncbi:MAG TPA: glycosyltransferase family 9 protein [Bryobacteraceae bacterium]|jgi:ADP-heptose:LPS heptosyltransferase|nr:glycosyltransferase family 9 protein [Bryobacteraceae bacterium]